MKELRDKWVLITGAGSGIGRALALEFTSEGSHIILVDMNEESMRETASLVRAKGGKTISIRTDTRRPEEVEALSRRAVEEAGRVDILVNNAGIALVAEMKDVTWDEWENILSVNLRGHILLTHYLLPHMITRGSGHIVNIASMAGLMGIPGMVPYTTTKFGLVGFSEALRIELSRCGIVVTVVCPGVVSTPIIHTSPIKGFSQDMRNAPAIITITPEVAARTIVRGIKRNKAKVLPGTILVKLAYVFSKYFPGLREIVVKRLYSRWERVPL